MYGNVGTKSVVGSLKNTLKGVDPDKRAVIKTFINKPAPTIVWSAVSSFGLLTLSQIKNNTIDKIAVIISRFLPSSVI